MGLNDTRLSKDPQPLLIKLFNELMNFIDQFTINSNNKIDDAGKKVREYNAWIDAYNKVKSEDHGRKSKLNENRMRMYIRLLQNNTIDELVKEEVISKRTKYNISRDLKKIKHMTSENKEKDLIDIELGFKKYFEVTGIVDNLHKEKD